MAKTGLSKEKVIQVLKSLMIPEYQLLIKKVDTEN